MWEDPRLTAATAEGVSFHPAEIAMTVAAERRHEDRGRSRVVWDVLFRGLRTSYQHAHSFGTALGMFLVFGALIAVAGRTRSPSWRGS